MLLLHTQDIYLGYDILAACSVITARKSRSFWTGAYKEINQTLEAELGVDPAQQEAFAKKARAKYCDKVIVDKVIRHAKDPIRKLGPQDRLVAPCRMALKHGIHPKTLI